MKKQIIKGLVIVGLAGTALPALAAALPSFGFEQEFAGVTANGDVSVDLASSFNYNIRVGAFGGEVMVDPAGGLNATGIGYKGKINRNFAAYGKLYLDSTTGASITNITLGVAYTGESGDFLYNGNGEIFNQSVGGTSTSTVDLKGAGFYHLHTSKFPGKVSLGGEISLQLSPSPTSTDLFLGARWEPKPSVLIDLGAMSSIGVGGTTTTTFATPAFIRLNLTL